MINHYSKEELVHLIDILPEDEILPAKRFLEFLVNQVPPLQQLIDREALVNKLQGKFAHLPGGSEEFMREKHEEIEREEKKWEERNL